jgi:hypothetical protein
MLERIVIHVDFPSEDQGPGKDYPYRMLSLAKFAQMTPEERTHALDELTSSAPNGVRLSAEIHDLEVRYEMTSRGMLERYRRGEIADTADSSRWLVLLSARGDR